MIQSEPLCRCTRSTVSDRRGCSNRPIVLHSFMDFEFCKQLGFAKVATTHLPASASMADAICISDTHLLPEQMWFGDDAPFQLAALLQAARPHFTAAYVLGDFLESLATGDQTHRYLFSSRTRPVFDALADFKEHAVVPGNHDINADGLLQEVFGDAVKPGGFTRHAVRYMHGHERVQDGSRLAALRGDVIVPLGALLGRVGVRVPTITYNAEIAGAFSGEGDYAVFGHTHAPQVMPTYANTGCFLRRGTQSFLTLKAGKASLWCRWRTM